MASTGAERPQETRNHTVKKESGNKIKRNKALLSAFLMVNMNGSLTVPDTDGYLLTEGHTSYGLPFLRTSEMKKNAVEEVYRKYGFNKAVKMKQRTFSMHKWSFRDRLYRSGRYIKTMTDIFEQEELPRELIFLPLIESQFKPLAYSSTRAAGPWQIMPATAKKLNLKMDWWVDERRDPVKSTRAAAQYLKYLYKKFGSWTLALAAYNAGEGRIRNAIRKTGSNDFWTLRKTGYITRETKNYVPSYIAATAIAMNPTDFGFKKISYRKPLKYDEAVIENPMGLELVAKFTGVDIRYIKDLNPELKRLCTPPNVPAYTIRLPRGTKKNFLAGLDKTKGYESYYVRFYTVRKGDTVEKIAMKLGSPVKAIIEMNDLGRRALIKAGKSIIVPFKRNLNWMVSGSGSRTSIH
jgi:membrane-bound lytic murein transglycosylase D